MVHICYECICIRHNQTNLCLADVLNDITRSFSDNPFQIVLLLHHFQRSLNANHLKWAKFIALYDWAGQHVTISLRAIFRSMYNRIILVFWQKLKRHENDLQYLLLVRDILKRLAFLSTTFQTDYTDVTSVIGLTKNKDMNDSSVIYLMTMKWTWLQFEEIGFS